MLVSLKLKKVFSYAMIIFIWVVAFLLLLEAATRFYLFGFNSFNYFKMNSNHALGKSGLIKPSSHLEIIYELRPNLNTYFKSKAFKTNSEGLRDKECTIEKPENTFRAVVLGASITMGRGVDNDEVFHSVLEERLNKTSAGLTYEVINFALGGSDYRQGLAILKYKALKYDPDLILFCFPFSTLKSEARYREVYKVEPQTYPFFESFFERLVRKKRMGSSLYERRKRTKGPDMENLPDAYSKLSEISKMRDIPVCIVILSYMSIAGRPDCEKAIDLSSEYGFYAIDTSLAFKDTGPPKKYRLDAVDSHPSAEAHKIFADVIYDYLTEQRLLEK